MRESSADTIEQSARRAGQRVGMRVLAGLAAVGAAGIVVGGVMAGRPRGAADRRLGPGAAVVRSDGRRVAPIERVAPARGRGRLPLYLAPATGAVVDSARVGVLVARLVPGTEAGPEPQIALVPRASVRGLRIVARLVVTPGEPGLLVFGRPGFAP